jgi:deazaflavin-dependent oxidoreductase (nitroreductase family)
MSSEGAFAYERANPVQKVLRRFAASGPGSWLFARVAPHLDRRVHRFTRGRHTLGSLITGLPVVMLTTTGAKSGQTRTVPVLGLPASGGVAVIASNWGQVRHPAWSHNLRAPPEAQVVIDGNRRRVLAAEVTGDRRAEIWQEALRIYPGFAQYERRASHRDISVFVLEPV